MPRVVGSIVAGTSLAVGALLGVYLVMAGSVPLSHVALAVVALAVAHFVAPAVYSGNRQSLSIAVAATIPFLFVGEEVVVLSSVVGAYLLGCALLALVEAVRRGDIVTGALAASHRLVGYTAFALTFAWGRAQLGSVLGDTGWEILVPFAAGMAVWLAVELLGWSVVTSSFQLASTRYLFLSAAKDANVFVSLVATGGLFGLMFDALSWWALPVALLPYSFAHGAFKRFHETKSTYKQTIRALAELPEIAGLNLAGHSDRTTRLAVAMAKDLGLGPDEVDEVEFAALMHDIGYITLNDPVVSQQGWTEDDLARWGAEITAGAPSLAVVAGHVRRQYESYRKPGEESDPSVSMASRIIRAASAYDAHRFGRGMSPLEALEELHQGAAYEYDPEVVASLRRVVDRSSALTV